MSSVEVPRAKPMVPGPGRQADVAGENQLQLRAQAPAPEDPDLVDVQAAISCRYHTCRTAVGVTREVRDRLADQETAAAKRVPFVKRRKIVHRTNTLLGPVKPGWKITRAASPGTNRPTFSTRKTTKRTLRNSISDRGESHRRTTLGCHRGSTRTKTRDVAGSARTATTASSTSTASQRCETRSTLARFPTRSAQQTGETWKGGREMSFKGGSLHCSAFLLSFKAPAKHASEAVLVVGEFLCTGVQAKHRETHKEGNARNVLMLGIQTTTIIQSGKAPFQQARSLHPTLGS